MTRKRFVKLLMSKGTQRNDAHRWAARVQEVGSYQMLFGIVYVQEGYFRIDIGLVADAFGNAMKGMTRYMRELRERILHIEPPHIGIDLGSGPDHTAILPVLTLPGTLLGSTPGMEDQESGEKGPCDDLSNAAGDGSGKD